MIKKLILALIITFAAFVIKAQDTIPFQLTTQNNISIETILNGKDTLNLMLHTAVTEVSIIEETATRIFELKSSKSVKAQSWGGESDAKYVNNNNLEIGNFRWDSVTVWVDKLSGPGTQGKFGPNLFKNQIIEINYDNKAVVIHPSLPESTQISEFTKFKIFFNRGIMFIKGELEIGEKVYSNQFMVHSGYGSTILLDDIFSSEHSIGAQLKTISESQLKDAYGNVLKTKKAILPVLNIGGFRFTDIPISFFEGSIGNQKSSVLGNEILQRFNIILDLQNADIYFKPNRLMKLPFKGAE